MPVCERERAVAAGHVWAAKRRPRPTVYAYGHPMNRYTRMNRPPQQLAPVTARSPRTQKLYEDAVSKKIRWQERIDDPPVKLRLVDVIHQQNELYVHSKERLRKKAKKPQPHYPRQPTSRHFIYDYLTRAQAKAYNKSVDNSCKAANSDQTRLKKKLRARKKEQQDNYVPDSPRKPPPHTKVKHPWGAHEDIFTAKQLATVEEGLRRNSGHKNGVHSKLLKIQEKRRVETAVKNPALNQMLSPQKKKQLADTMSENEKKFEQESDIEDYEFSYMK